MKRNGKIVRKPMPVAQLLAWKNKPSISKALLLTAARLGPKWGYNRQLCDKKIAKIPDGHYCIVDTIPHYHACFQRVPEHRRLVVEIDGGLAFVDVPLTFFERVLNVSERAAA